jgi:serine/threonine protein kinase
VNLPLETAAGQQRAWNLLEKLGEGDAGEVYRVESLMDRRTAILKRPRRSAFPSDIIRQATQIEREGRVLRLLERLSSNDLAYHAPNLLDRSQDATEFSERFFIVITPATGLSLASLAQAARLGERPSLDTFATQPSDKQSLIEDIYLKHLADTGKLPDLILLRAISGLLEYLEAIHTLESDTPAGKAFGVLWNDVKPEHIFWEPRETGFTIIDWGNAQFIEADGITKDRQFSRTGDHQQFIDEMGRFLEDHAPELYHRLEWPKHIPPGSIFASGIQPLKERLAELLQVENQALAQARLAEADILESAGPNFKQLSQLGQLHVQMIYMGEIPAYEGAERFFERLAQQLVQEDNLSEVLHLCEIAKRIPFLDDDYCQLVHLMTKGTLDGALPRDALSFGVVGDWASALWQLRAATLDQPEPAWWDELSSIVRRVETGSDSLRPLVALNRLIHALQAVAQRSEEPEPYEQLAAMLKQEILPRWTQLEPDPPFSGIQYEEIERQLEAIQELMPEAARSLVQALDQPRAQVQIVLDAFEQKDFDTSRRALRKVLLWDPDRGRLLKADHALALAPVWMAEVRRGLPEDEPMQDFITRLELVGREMRSQIAPAVWLDALLESFKQLRRGVDPTEVLVEHPEVRDDLGWLITLEPRRPLLTSPDKTVSLERIPLPQETRPTLFGVKEALLGMETGVKLGAPLDTWAHEARGSSARIFQGELASLSGASRPAAMKLMRPDRAEYALPLFIEETRILSLLRDVPGVVPLLECGFIHLEQPSLPPEDRTASAEGLSGSITRFGLDSVHNFLADIEKRTAQGWIPYLAIEQQVQSNNLLLLCDTGYTRGRFTPILDGLIMAIQICDLLEVAHSRNIVYRDHKILHYYWQNEYNGIFMLDWNVAKRYPEGLSLNETQFDLVQFGARALHYILTGRPATGALPLGPNRPEEIEAAARTYTANWTYDDHRLPKDVKDILEAVLEGGYSQARQLREDLYTIYNKLLELVK